MINHNSEQKSSTMSPLQGKDCDNYLRSSGAEEWPGHAPPQMQDAAQRGIAERKAEGRQAAPVTHDGQPEPGDHAGRRPHRQPQLDAGQEGRCFAPDVPYLGGDLLGGFHVEGHGGLAS